MRWKCGLMASTIRFGVSGAQMVALFETSKANISEHIKHIFVKDELLKETTVRNFRIVQQEGKRTVV